MIKYGLLSDLWQTFGAEGRGKFEVGVYPIQIAWNISMHITNEVLS